MFILIDAKYQKYAFLFAEKTAITVDCSIFEIPFSKIEQLFGQNRHWALAMNNLNSSHFW